MIFYRLFHWSKVSYENKYYRVSEVLPLEDYYLKIIFDDNQSMILDMKEFIKSELSLKLLDEDFFDKVSVESSGGIIWPNGFDFCPNYLRELYESRKTKI